MNNKADLINHFVLKYKYKKYLEIGLFNRTFNFNKINIPYKKSIDIKSDPDYLMTSDEYFKKYDEVFDVILVDGSHIRAQVYTDVINSLNVLSENGIIICHDLNPILEIHQFIRSKVATWNGDCWKAWVDLRLKRSDLEMYVIDIDCGCGIIKRGKQNVLVGPIEFSWEQFDKNRKQWLNMITVEEFKQKENL